MPIFDVLAHGARGDGERDDASAIQAAIDACAAAGGGTVLLPAGRVYLCGALSLKSHVDLHIERGAVLRASRRREDFARHFYGGREQGTPIFIGAEHADHAAITGGGVIEGQGLAWMTAELPHMFKCTVPKRPHLICLHGCRHLTVRDVTLRDAANWTLHLVGCEDVLIHGIRILNGLKVPNCDGIDPDRCRNVRISDCHIEAGDDCIVIKNRPEYPDYGPSENITITNCTLISTSAAVKIGTESTDRFRAITVSNCVIRGSNRGLAIQLRDHGDVEDVLFSGCVVETRFFHEDWWGAAEPIYVTAFPRRRDTRLGRIRHVRFRDILCRGENGAYLGAIAPGHIEDVTFDGVDIEVARSSKHSGGVHDRRPCGFAGRVRHPTAGVYAQHVAGLALRDVAVRWGGERASWFRHAVEGHALPDLRMVDVRGEGAHPGIAAIHVDDVAPAIELLDREDRGAECGAPATPEARPAGR